MSLIHFFFVQYFLSVNYTTIIFQRDQWFQTNFNLFYVYIKFKKKIVKICETQKYHIYVNVFN